MRPAVFLAMAVACVVVFESSSTDQKKKAARKTRKTNSATKKVELDPLHRPLKKLLNVPARYYVWYSDEEWHLRSACTKGLRRFKGTVTLKAGRLRKCRPIGLELKPNKRKNHDSFTLDKDRKKLTFHLVTGKSYDGFDFTLSEPNADIAFDLSIGKKKYLKRVFIGRKGQHPATFPFLLRLPQPKADVKPR